jgi:hypothetical protein
VETTNENLNITRQRHGFVSAWLILMIVANSFLTLRYLFAGVWIIKKLPEGISTSMLISLGILSAANALFSLLLFRWKKWAFFGFVITAICSHYCPTVKLVKSL